MNITALGRICLLSGWYSLSSSTSARTLFDIPAQYAAVQTTYTFSKITTSNTIYGGYVQNKKFAIESTSPAGTYTITCAYIR